MLTDPPTAAVHTYNPPGDPEEAAALRASFEHEENDPSACSSPAHSSLPPPESDSDNSQESSAQFSPPPRIDTTPLRRRHAHGHSSSVNIHFTPNVAVHIDSGMLQLLTPGILLVDSCLAVDSIGSGQMSPTKQSPMRGVSLGRRLLNADGFPKGMVKEIEQLLLSCSSSDAFVAAVVGDKEIGMSTKKASLVWDLYKLV